MFKQRVKIAPSLLSGDFNNLEKSYNLVSECGADIIHYDVMDGHFVPNLTYGAGIVKAAKSVTNLEFDVHLMVTNPDAVINWFNLDNVKSISVHYEASTHLHRILQNIKSMGKMAGIAINPHTSPEELKYILDYCDFVLVMSVNPGFGGQSFIQNTYEKVSYLNEVRNQNNYNFEIHVDGGVNADNANKLVELGANQLIMGTAFFKDKNPKALIRDIKFYAH